MRGRGGGTEGLPLELGQLGLELPLKVSWREICCQNSNSAQWAGAKHSARCSGSPGSSAGASGAVLGH